MPSREHAYLACCPCISGRARGLRTTAQCEILGHRSPRPQAHPELAVSKATEGRGTVLSCLIGRLRDKKAGVRREAASQAAAVMRAWVLAGAAGAGSAPRIEIIMGIPMVLCNLAVRDPELGVHTFDVVFKSGLFPAKLPPAEVAHLWSLLWKKAGERGGRAGGWRHRPRGLCTGEPAPASGACMLCRSARWQAVALLGRSSCLVHTLLLLQARRAAQCSPRFCRFGELLSSHPLAGLARCTLPTCAVPPRLPADGQLACLDA